METATVVASVWTKKLFPKGEKVKNVEELDKYTK